MKLEEVFSFKNMMLCASKCIKGVGWKRSTQNFEYHMMEYVYLVRKAVLAGVYKSKGFNKFSRQEHGKRRNIQAPHITERMLQKCFCDFCLLPIFQPTFIYDNGACFKKKGTSFAVKRTKKMVHNYYVNHKSNEGYILQMDIKSFFESIDHKTLIEMVREKVDKPLFELYKYLVDCFDGDAGIGLGSQISQVSASIYLNKLDHQVKDQMQVRYYSRHMDDSWIISESKDQLRIYLKEIQKTITELKLRLNDKKTQIRPLRDFKYLKRRFTLHENGKQTMKPHKPNILRAKRKHRKLTASGNIDAANNVDGSLTGYLKEFNYINRYTRRENEVQVKTSNNKSSR